LQKGYTRAVASFNSIIPGSAWAQLFRFPAGGIDYAGGETLLANFRRNAASPLAFAVTEPTGISRNGNDYTIGLTGAQTNSFIGFDRVAFDLYAVKAGVTRALGLRVHVPVVTGL
jgi:hypothetical protein